ncbi:unnamed protein product [Brassica rapa subsp. narinosa]
MSSLLVLSVLLGLCYGSGLLLSAAVGFVSPKAAVFGFILPGDISWSSCSIPVAS